MSNQIICKDCGNENQRGDQFCGSCGSFLEWTGETVPDLGVETLTEAIPNEAIPTSTESTFVSQLKRAIEVDPLSVAHHHAARQHELDADTALSAQVTAAREQAEQERRAAIEAQHRLEERASAEAEEIAAHRRAEVAEQAAEMARQHADETDEKGTAEMATLEAQAVALRATAEASAATMRAATQRIRQRVEAEEAQRQRDEALRRAAALVAPRSEPGPILPTAKQPTKSRSATDATGSSAALGSDASAQGSPPEARQPGQERVRRGPKRSVSSELNAGDVVCGQCGAGNPSTRKFCRRCGAVLAEAVSVRLGWWARVKRLFSRTPKSFTAGERRSRTNPGRTDSGRRGQGVRNAFFKVNTTLLRIGAALGILALLGLGVEPIRAKLHLPNVRQQAIDKVREVFTPIYDQVHATASTGPGAPGHGVDQLIDGANNTWWSAPSGSGGARSAFTVSFAKPVDLARLLITSGVPGGQQGATFVSQPRPSEFQVTINGDTQRTHAFSLKDKGTPQAVKLVAKRVQRLDVEVLQVYPASPASTVGVAITELEFFSKRKYGDDYETIAIPQVSASSSPEQLKFLVDGDINTAWTSTPLDDGVGQQVTVRFAEPVDLARVRISTGYGSDTTRVGTRPAQVQLVLSCEQRCDPTVQVRVPDKPGLHTTALKAQKVTQVQLQIRTVHGSGGGAAISELQFQRKRPTND